MLLMKKTKRTGLPPKEHHYSIHSFIFVCFIHSFIYNSFIKKKQEKNKYYIFYFNSFIKIKRNMKKTKCENKVELRCILSVC